MPARATKSASAETTCRSERMIYLLHGSKKPGSGSILCRRVEIGRYSAGAGRPSGSHLRQREIELGEVMPPGDLGGRGRRDEKSKARVCGLNGEVRCHAEG